MSRIFTSVNPTFHQYLNVYLSGVIVDGWKENPESTCFIFDGPDIKTTCTLIQHPEYSHSYSDNITYFQKDTNASKIQEKNLNQRWGLRKARNQLKKGSFEEAIDLKNLRASSITLLPANENAHLAYAFLDSMSYSAKFHLILEKMMAFKAYQRKDNTPLTLFCNEVACASDRKMLMLRSLARTSDKWQAILEQQEENRASLKADILLKGKVRLLQLAEKYGFKLAPVTPMPEEYTRESVCCIADNDYQAVLYDGGAGSTMMHFFAFKLVKSRQLENIETLVEDVDEKEFEEIVDDDMLDYDQFEELQSQCYCDYFVVKKVHDTLQTMLANHDKRVRNVFDRVQNKTSIEVVDILMNINLPFNHMDKGMKYLILQAPERSGKGTMPEIQRIITDMPEFQFYATNPQHLCPETLCRGVTSHVIGGPNVTIVVADLYKKSIDFMEKVHGNDRHFEKLIKAGKGFDKSIAKNKRASYVSGMSKNNIDKLLKIATVINDKYDVQSSITYDEADFLFSGKSQACESVKSSLSNRAICGHIFQTATPMGLLLREPESRIIDGGRVEVFITNASEDYTNAYNVIYDLNGSEKFDVDEDNNIHKSVQDYLSEDLCDAKYRNGTLRVFPIMVVMPSSAVNTETGTMNMARRLSAGEYRHVNFTHDAPLCICFCGDADKFHLFDNGEEIPFTELETDEVKVKELQNYLPLVGKKYGFRRHIIVFGYIVWKRGVTSQFSSVWTNEDGEEQKILGVPSYLTCIIKPNNGEYKRPIGDMRQMIRRYPICRRDFDVPFFEDYSCKLTCNEELLEILHEMEKEEMKCLQCVDKTKNLDEAWKMFEPNVLYETAQTVNIRKRKLEDVYESEGKQVKRRHEKSRKTTSYGWTQHQCLKWVLTKLPADIMKEFHDEAKRLEKIRKEKEGTYLRTDLALIIVEYLLRNERVINKVIKVDRKIALKFDGSDDKRKTKEILKSEMMDGEPYFLLSIKNYELRAGPKRIKELLTFAVKQRFMDDRMPIVDGKFSTEWQKKMQR